MSQTISAEFVQTADCEIYAVETRGNLKHMPRNDQMVRAIYGIFERTDQSTLLYTAIVGREKDGSIGHYPDSEYLDDLRQLKSGNIDII